MANIKIAFINESHLVTDAEARDLMDALQIQVSKHFAPVWGVDAALRFFKKGGPVPGGYWWLVLLDNSDQAGDLGYHDLTSEGMPLGKVFVKADIQNKSSWTNTASHELLEMLIDPDVNLAVLDQTTKKTGILYSYEVCDACEDDSFGYIIITPKTRARILVSDFVYPSWFQSFKHPASTKFDYKGHISKPFQLLLNGYAQVLDVSTASGWTQLNPPGAQLEYRMRAKVGSRRERRRTPREQWMCSRKEIKA